MESQALTLISRLEEHKLHQADELRRRAEEGKDRIRQAKLAMDKTWWDHTMDYVNSGDFLKDPIHVKLHFTRGQEITLIFEITFTPRLVIFRRVNYSTGNKIYSTGSKNYSTKGS